MPRFFFNFRDATDFDRDEEGLELPDLDAAYLEAFEAAKEMWGEAIRELRNPGRQQIEICDADGKTLLIVPLREVLDSLKGVSKPPPMQTAERAAKLSAEVEEAVRTAHHRLREARTLLAQLLT
jgi:hypothetical protein